MQGSTCTSESARSIRLQHKTNNAEAVESDGFASPIYIQSDYRMPSIASFILAPVHLLAYSTLLGTELYQTFVMTKISYQALPRSAFTTLQKRVFPIYFKGQSLLLFLVTVTIPPHGPFSVLSTRTQWTTFLVAGVTAGLNLLVYGPRTQNLMIQRLHQGIKS
jgi:hypothetical protein